MSVAEILSLLVGSVVHRPYVYAFFVCFLVFATVHLGWKRMLAFLVSTWVVAFASEYSSTRNGFPFGFYRYFDDARSQELWISNVPFWDSLSFVFLSYFSFVLAAQLLGGPSKLDDKRVPLLGRVLMMLLDVVIDPVGLQGDKWFLGRIYEYPYRGFYFGVTAANFAGWFFVGAVSMFLHQRMFRAQSRATHPLFAWGVYGVYAGIFAFNLAITIYIRDTTLALASTLVSASTLGAVAVRMRRLGRDRHRAQKLEHA